LLHTMLEGPMEYVNARLLCFMITQILNIK
jgi:hypothetical protein